MRKSKKPNVRIENFQFTSIPDPPAMKDYSWYKSIVLQAQRNKKEAVFLTHAEVNTGYFTDNVRRRSRILGFSVNVLCNASGWYVWFRDDMLGPMTRSRRSH